MAVRAPEKCKKLLYNSISPINILRFAIVCVENKEPNYLEDISFFSWSRNLGGDDKIYKYPEEVILTIPPK